MFLFKGSSVFCWFLELFWSLRCPWVACLNRLCKGVNLKCLTRSYLANKGWNSALFARKPVKGSSNKGSTWQVWKALWLGEAESSQKYLSNFIEVTTKKVLKFSVLLFTRVEALVTQHVNEKIWDFVKKKFGKKEWLRYEKQVKDWVWTRRAVFVTVKQS